MHQPERTRTASQCSSPERSTTSSIKTQREMELEEKVDALQTANSELQQQKLELQKELATFKQEFAEMKTEQAKAFAQLQHLHTSQMAEQFAEMRKEMLAANGAQLQAEEPRQSVSPKSTRKRRNLKETPIKMSRELKSLQLRQGDIWHMENMHVDESTSRPQSPAEVPPDPGGASANPK